MDCFSCRTTDCCPEHCCDWDSCKCKDCENCGGVSSAKPIKSARSSKTSASEDVILSHSIKVATPARKENSVTEMIEEMVKLRIKEQREEEARVRREYDEKRRIDKEKHDAILASTRATIERNKEVLERTNGTIERLRGTIDGCRETEKKFQDFQDSFSRIMGEALAKCLGVETNPAELREKHGIPKESSVNEVAEIIASANSISFITGAGVSAESGVFTYKGNKETWEIAGNQLTLQEVMNINILQSHPLEFWQNIQFNRKRFSECRPNQVHQALGDLMQLFRTKGKKAALVTQNIDGFDRITQRNLDDLYEIHGNTNEMRCSADCCKDICPCPSLDEMISTVPLCRKCGAIARPNVLLYGESYTEEWYRAESAARAVKESEVLIVIGTQMKCGFPNQKTSEFCKAGKIVIEINIDPVIEFGKVYVLPRKSIEVFPAIVETVKNSFKRRK